MNPKEVIVFVDRDGTINKEKDLICDPSALELIPESAKAIKLLKEKGFIIVIVTNQPQVARGICSEEQVQLINKTLLAMLSDLGAQVDAIYYCPHHPDKGYKGENSKYKIDCECRKPKIGMLIQAAKRFNVNLDRCYVIGDQTRDIQLARNAHCKGILVQTGYSGNDGKYTVTPDKTCKDLMDAAEFIIRSFL